MKWQGKITGFLGWGNSWWAKRFWFRKLYISFFSRCQYIFFSFPLNKNIPMSSNCNHYRNTVSMSFNSESPWRRDDTNNLELDLLWAFRFCELYCESNQRLFGNQYAARSLVTDRGFFCCCCNMCLLRFTVMFVTVHVCILIDASGETGNSLTISGTNIVNSKW